MVCGIISNVPPWWRWLVLILQAVSLLKLDAYAVSQVLNDRSNNKASAPDVVCIYGSWAAYRRLPGRLLADGIPAQLCTHVVYAYAAIVDNEIVPYDLYVDLASENHAARFGNYARLVALKQRNPNLKLLIGIGGWNAGGAGFSNMASNATGRIAFAYSALRFINTYGGFDGIWLDWLYPGDATRGGRMPDDRENFGILLEELRNALEGEAVSHIPKRNFLIGLSVSGVPSLMANYDVASINKYADLIGLITYDLYGAWSEAALHHAPLLPWSQSSADNSNNNNSSPTTSYSVATSVNLAVSIGLDKSKLLLGIPTYGRNYMLADSNKIDAGSRIRGPGPAAPVTEVPGTKAYYEICLDLDHNAWKKGEISGTGGAPYAVKGLEWIGYDNEFSVRKKAEYAVEQNMAGISIFSLEQDDPNGYCGIPFPLTNSARLGLGLPLVDTTVDKVFYKCVAYAAAAHKNCSLRIPCSYFPTTVWGPNEVGCGDKPRDKCLPPEVYDCVVNTELLDLVGTRPFTELQVQAGPQSSMRLQCKKDDVQSELQAPGYFVQCSSNTLGGESIIQYKCPPFAEFSLSDKACRLP